MDDMKVFKDFLRTIPIGVELRTDNKLTLPWDINSCRSFFFVPNTKGPLWFPKSRVGVSLSSLEKCILNACRNYHGFKFLSAKV